MNNTTSGDGLCDRRCLRAKKPDCSCRCLGRNHGVLRLAEERGERTEIWLGHIPYIAAAFSLRKCLNCGGEDLDILGYPHDDGGVYISQYRMKLWVFGRCRRCGYENSLKKLEDTRGLQLGPVATDVDDLAYYVAVVSSLAGEDFTQLVGKAHLLDIDTRAVTKISQNGNLNELDDYFKLRSWWVSDRYIRSTRYRDLKERYPDVDARIAARAAEYLRVFPKPF